MATIDGARFGGEITFHPAAGLKDPLSPTVHAQILDGWDPSQTHFLPAPHAGWRRICADALRRQCARRRAIS